MWSPHSVEVVGRIDDDGEGRIRARQSLGQFGPAYAAREGDNRISTWRS